MILTVLVTILNFAVIAAPYYQSQINERTRVELETLRAELERLEERVRPDTSPIAPTA